MFVFNLKFNKTVILKTFIFILIIISLLVLCASIYKIFNSAQATVTVNDTINTQNIINIDSKNYTNVLKTVYDNLDNYVGQTITFTGYIHRLFDFPENQFVLARDMIISSDNQTLIVGFLCSYKDATQFTDKTWVKIQGKITKGNYHGEIPVIEITSIQKTDKPKDEFVYPPDSTYIPTSILF